MNAKIAYTGLGIMGQPAATHLVKAGHSLRVFARRPEAAQPLVDIGAVACNSPAEAAQGCQFAFTNVSDTPDALEVIVGDNGYINTLEKGAVVIDMSTIAPSAAREIGERLGQKGIGFIDAPVSGGQAGAEAGTLAFMCGGKREDFDLALPILQAMGKSIVLVGGCGAGQVAKCVNQVLIGATVDAVAESFLMAKKLGVDPAKIREAISGGFAGSKVLEVHANRMIEDNFEPGFKARLHLKDIGIAIDAAKEAGVGLPSAEKTKERLAKVVGEGMGDLDSSIACKALDDWGS